MYLKKFVQTACLCLVGFFCSTHSAKAQESTIEFWPEIDLWYRVSPAWRFSAFVPLSNNLETKYKEGSLVVQADYAFGKTRVLHYRRMLDDAHVGKGLLRKQRPYVHPLRPFAHPAGLAATVNLQNLTSLLMGIFSSIFTRFLFS